MRTALAPTLSAVLLVPALVAAQATVRAGVPAARPRLLLTSVSFYGRSANSIEPGDSAMAGVVTARLWDTLRGATAVEVIDSATSAAALARAATPGHRCDATVACARGVARELGATWAVTGTVSKTSNLIWYFSGQLIDVASGRLLMDDEFELKGGRDDMVPRGAVSFARRVRQAVERAAGAPDAPTGPVPAATTDSATRPSR